MTYQETGDAAEAFAKLKKNRNKCIEGKLLAGLVKNNTNDYVNALENVSIEIRIILTYFYLNLF